MLKREVGDTMYDNFNVEDSLEKIKSSLFDIYESQERIIGSISDDEEKAKQVQKYIETKDLAIQLLENISSLYPKNDNLEKNYVSVENEIKEEQSMVEENESVDETDETFNEEEVSLPINVDEEMVQEDNNELEENLTNEDDVEPGEDINDDIVNDNNTENIEEDSEEQEVEKFDSDVNKFYLDDRNGSKPNFAYVPEALYIKIKENGNAGNSNKIYKQDQEKVKGIIVRNDQFMKLSFSKHRQEGVLKEAKAFRIEQARKSRQKLQEEALEKGKVELNI